VACFLNGAFPGVGSLAAVRGRVGQRFDYFLKLERSTPAIHA
jgi:hypothetical protein